MISVRNLTKYYGDHLAVDDISFEITGGHVYGFLGPNGAGKSTTMNIMTGCLSASAGSVLIDGHDIFEEPRLAKRLMGYLPEQPPLYMNESPLEYLRFVGQAKGIKRAELTRQINDIVERTGIYHVRNQRISQLSKGYRQRVGIAQALLGNPGVIILDEPTVGLDPLQIIQIRELITELGKDHTVIFSSHILSEVQAICDEILMIARGRLIAFGEPQQLQRQFLRQGELLLTTDVEEKRLREILEAVSGIAAMTVEIGDTGYLNAHIKADNDDMYSLSSAVFRAFAASDSMIYEMAIKKGDLEDVFIELTENADVQPEDTEENMESEDAEL